MQILQKIYFIFAVSYIVYFFFTIQDYKYKILKSNFKFTTIVYLIIFFIMVFSFILFNGYKIQYTWTINEDDIFEWKKVDLDNYLSEKKKELLIQEAMHKTFKWKETFKNVVKLLASNKDITMKKVEDIIAFFYSSNFIEFDDDTEYNNTGIMEELRNILGIDEFGKKGNKKIVTGSDKNTIIKIVLDLIDDTKNFTNDDGPTRKGLLYFNELDKNIPKSVLIKQLKHFITGFMPNFDIIFTIFGGRDIYTAPFIDKEERRLVGGAMVPGAGGAAVRRESDSSLTELSPDGLTAASAIAVPRLDEDDDSEYTATNVRIKGPVKKDQTKEDRFYNNRIEIDSEHLWGYGVTSDSIVTGGLLKKPLISALETLKRWIPIGFEFYDIKIPDEYINSEGGGISYKIQKLMGGKYGPGTIVSSRGAGYFDFLYDNANQRKLNNIVLNNLDVNELNYNDNKNEIKELNSRLSNINEVIEYLKKNPINDKIISGQIIGILENKLAAYKEGILLNNVKSTPINISASIDGKSIEEKIYDIFTIKPNEELDNKQVISKLNQIISNEKKIFQLFSKNMSGYKNYPEWLKNNLIIKMKAHRDVAEKISSFDNISDYKHESIGDPILDSNKIGRTAKNIDDEILLKKKIFNIEEKEQVGGGGIAGAPGGAPAEDINLDDWNDRILSSDEKYETLYEVLKNDIDLNALNKDPGEVSQEEKKKFSSTNYQNKENKNTKYDYFNEFLKFSVYYGNLNLFIILLTVISYLGTYKKTVVDKSNNITEYDKNIFNDQINKQIKYSRSFIFIFLLISIFSYNGIIKYSKLLITIVTSQEDFIDTMVRLFNTHKIKTIIAIFSFSLLLISLFGIPSFVNARKKQRNKLSDLFTKDLNRTSKLDPDKDFYDEKTKGNYICYNNICTNNTNIKSKAQKKYKMKNFKNLQDCKKSGCGNNEMENSGIAAVKYSEVVIN